MNFFCFANSKALLRYMHKDGDLKCEPCAAFGRVGRAFEVTPRCGHLRSFKPISVRMSYHADKGRLGEGVLAEYGTAHKKGALEAALKQADAKGGASQGTAARL